jgi:hypothetical protein
VNTDWNLFAHRIGIAYSPSSKWSFRTGFGILYSQVSANSKFDLNRGLSGRASRVPAVEELLPLHIKISSMRPRCRSSCPLG